MGDDYIGVHFATLQSLSEELEDVLRQLNARLDELYARVEKAVLSWEGQARSSFVDELDRWDQEMQDLQAAQKWLHEVVSTGQSNYGAAHRAVLRGWGARP
ncbi:MULTISPECIES: WXG100 family type VII secretion target [unclassified Streptomyces]|uniref:WXG100 family type VII secretion target n=1 Tax=unclassified Streptomyces TaxID=2593676 RepID=UPI00288C1E0B|nr:MULTISPECIES: WXG100 family type VII secretion target [unclassified Streptomyces]WNI29963.1 WXG100 family type VII secretion target [Streptomyces sp. ITFR-6]